MLPRPDSFIGDQRHDDQLNNQKPNVGGGEPVEQNLEGMAHDE